MISIFSSSLNCAIVNLNDSIVFTPSKDPDMLKTPCLTSKVKQVDENNIAKEEENNRNLTNYKINEISKLSDSGFISRIDNLKLDSVESKTAVAQSTDGKISYRSLKSRTQLFNDESSKSAPTSSVTIQNDPAKNIPPSRNQHMSISEFRKSHSSKVADDDKETPLKKEPPKDNFHFVTPSSRPPLSTIVDPFSSSTTKTNFEQDKKVIYRTPKVDVAPMLPPSSVSREISTKPTNTSSALSSSSINQNILLIKNVEYILDKKIGSGGSSLVYLAKRKSTGIEVAIKVVNLSGGDDQIIEGYINETKLLARLQGNINVVKLYDYWLQPQRNLLYMVMEKGESDLHRILQTYRSNIPLFKLMSFWHQMLQAVDYIHQNGVIHSDLKPANFLMINGRLKLIDFGIASNISCDATSVIKFSQAGTFNYISPEALTDTSTGESPMRGNQPKIRLSTRSDVWSLGCILYLLIYKKTPFSHIKSLPQKVTAITNPKLSIDYPELPNYYPPLLIEMLKRCLVHSPKARASCAELLAYPFEMIIPIDEHP